MGLPRIKKPYFDGSALASFILKTGRHVASPIQFAYSAVLPYLVEKKTAPFVVCSLSQVEEIYFISFMSSRFDLTIKSQLNISCVR